MTKHRELKLKPDEGAGCTPSGRCYRWELRNGGDIIFRGPGLSVSRQPGKRHPAYIMAQEWLKARGKK